MKPGDDVTRREFVGVTTAVIALSGATTEIAPAAPADYSVHCSLTINGDPHDPALERRVTLLDLLREQLHLTGTKKGCDHGQYGACTALINGARVNSCLMLAVAQDGNRITTIEGMAAGGDLHPMQAAFLDHDGFQFGFCTSGQICSAVAMLQEWKAGMPSVVSFAPAGPPPAAGLDDAEIRERMAWRVAASEEALRGREATEPAFREAADFW